MNDIPQLFERTKIFTQPNPKHEHGIIQEDKSVCTKQVENYKIHTKSCVGGQVLLSSPLLNPTVVGLSIQKMTRLQHQGFSQVQIGVMLLR